MGFVGRLRWVAAAPAAAALLALSGGHAVAQTPQQIQQLADQAIRRLDLQTNFPVVPEPPRLLSLPAEVLWIVIGVAVAFLLYTFRDLIPILRSSRGDNWISEDAIGGGGKAGSPAAALGAADDLAAQGRFVEAMHVLLLQGLAAIRAGLDEEFAELAHKPRDLAPRPLVGSRPRVAARYRQPRGMDLFRPVSRRARRL